MMMYLFTTVPHPHGHWQPQELFGNQKIYGLADVLVKSPRKLLIVDVRNIIYRIKACKSI